MARERLEQSALDALTKLRKGTFDPADVGADARRKIFTAAYVAALEVNSTAPSEGFVRAMLDAAGVDGRRTSRMVEEHTPIVADAFQAYLDKKILERIGFAERSNLVKIDSPPAAEAPTVPETSLADRDQVVTTAGELKVFDYVRTRLSFLVKDEAHYNAISDVSHVDRKTVFIVYYKQERKGRLFNLTESAGGMLCFDFPDEASVETTSLGDIDHVLLKTFLRRVGELG